MRNQVPRTGGDIAWPLPQWWMPMVNGWSVANDRVHQVSINLSIEWQTFIGRRLNDDVRLLQQLSTARAPDEAWHAWLQFWQKAVEDYAAEYPVMVGLATDLLPTTITADADRDTGSAALATKAA
jgi:hypothetical protein